jgi:energy-coupling factor transport system substrate-specific component
MVQGLGAELIFAIFLYRRFGIVVAGLAGAGAGVAAWIFEMFYGSSPNILKTIEFNTIYLACLIVSGVVLAGVVGWLLVRALAATGALNRFAAGRELVREV